MDRLQGGARADAATCGCYLADREVDERPVVRGAGREADEAGALPGGCLANDGSRLLAGVKVVNRSRTGTRRREARKAREAPGEAHGVRARRAVGNGLLGEGAVRCEQDDPGGVDLRLARRRCDGDRACPHLVGVVRPVDDDGLKPGRDTSAEEVGPNKAGLTSRVNRVPARHARDGHAAVGDVPHEINVSANEVNDEDQDALGRPDRRVVPRERSLADRAGSSGVAL